jgi:hypothetical protein
MMGAPARIELLIMLTEDGQVQVQGPVQQKLLCYGMLAMARDAIRDFKPDESGLLLPQSTLR